MKSKELLQSYADGLRNFGKVELSSSSLKGAKLCHINLEAATLVDVNLVKVDFLTLNFLKLDLRERI